MPFSPLGKGFLTGRIDETTTLEKLRLPQLDSPSIPGHARRTAPSWSSSSGSRKRKGATAAQIALAWVLAQQPWIVPIPGTDSLHRVDENIAAADVELTADDLREIETAAAQIEPEGARDAGGPAGADRPLIGVARARGPRLRASRGAVSAAGGHGIQPPASGSPRRSPKRSSRPGTVSGCISRP